ncbi:Clathrin_heavy chain [Hexamita inflata]|uniref:Clathrin heavy chain n=1 Tax=Hexamita inflata TaxID=28002 RepID=A0AA86TF37_9EUKA|nr:Clathrin heavy chain [Hexamita inflata]
MSQPISLTPFMNARERLVPDTSLKSAMFSLSSELGFCAKDDTSGTPMLRVVNSYDQSQDNVIPMKAEAAILAPHDPSIVILRVPTMLQALSLSTKANLGRHTFAQPVQIDFWTWLDNERIAIVCPEAVYVWTYATDNYVCLFQRDPTLLSNLGQGKITSVQLSPDNDWAVLQAVGLDQSTNSVQGNFQLYCFSKAVSKVLPGHAATLTSYREDDTHPVCTILSFAHKQPGAVEIDMNMIEAGPQKDANGNALSGFVKKQFKIPVNPAIAQQEFPMFMRSSQKYGFVYTVTKTGMLYVHDLGSASTIYQVQASQRGVFAVSGASQGELVIASADGNLMKLDISADMIVDYIMSRLGKAEAAFHLAMRANLRGADKLFSAQFENMFSQRNWREAALLVKKSPSDTLRNGQTLQRFCDAGDTIQMGEKPPVLIYLGTLLENEGALQNEAESLELVKQFANQGKIQSIETYLNNKKLFECEGLGDVLLQNGLDKLAFRIYNQAQCHEKCILYLIQQNNLDGIVKYAERFPQYHPDYALIIQKGLGMGTGFSADGIERLKMFADSIIAKLDTTAQAADIVGIATSFKNFGYVKEGTFLLLEVCKRLDFSEMSGPYQTQILLMNLEANAPFAEALLAKNKLTSFDRVSVYQACEQAQLYQRAFEFADNDDECLRIAIQYGNQLQKPIFESAEWFAEYCRACGRFDINYYNNDTQSCVDALFNFQQALLDVCVNEVRVYAPHVAMAFSRLPVIATSTELISAAVEVFKAYHLDGTEALFSFLASIFPSSIDSSIHKMYLQCAIQLQGHDNDIIRVARESHYIAGEEAFQILTTTPNKSDSAVVTALLTICSRFKLSAVLAKFLCEATIKREKTAQFFVQNAAAIVEQYLVSFAPEESHIILQSLFDNGVLSSNDVGVLDGIFSIDFLSRVLANQQVRDRSDIGLVVEACMFNGKTIKIVRQMLEQRLMSGATDQITHTAFAKIMVETRANECEKYLVENPYYDHHQLCVFCIQNDKRRRDSFVQTMALKAAVVGAFNPMNPVEIRSQKCATFIIELAFGCSMYRELSTILLKRGSKVMWDMTMSGDFKPISAEFFTINNTRSLAQHREMFSQAVAGNSSVQVEKLEDNVVAACIASFVGIQDTDPKISKCLMLLLERIILTPGSVHMKNSALHNLLVIAAVKARELQKVSQFVKMTELVFDPDVVAQVCVQVARDQNLPQFYEDAFEIYRRFDKLTEGVKVLIKYMTIERAEKFAENINNPEVFVVLGVAQLETAQKNISEGQAVLACQFIGKAARAFIRARDGSQYRILIQTVFKFAEEYIQTYFNEVVGAFNNLIEFLRGARTVMFVQQKYAEHSEIDSALMYCYVKLDKYEELESFLQLCNAIGAGIVPNKGDIEKIGDRAFSEMRYMAAKMLFQKISMWSKLALTLLKLQDYQNAVDAARRADEVPIWRQVNAACLLANQIQLAKTAGLYLIVLPDELPLISKFYQENVRIVELIELLESGIEHPQAKAYTNKEQNLFTHLALLYAKFMWLVDQPGSLRLSRFLKSNSDKVSIPLCIQECRKNLLWNEVVYMYVLSNENDQAVSEMMKHPGSFDHKQLLQICGYVSQPDLLVQLTDFYIKFYPQNLVEFLKVSKNGYFQTEEIIDTKRKDFLSVDPLAVLRLVKEYAIERLARQYFELLIEDGLIEINNELVNIYIQQRDEKALVELIKKTTQFDTYATLDRLVDEKQTQALRRTAVPVYAALKRFDEGIEYAVKNRFYDEASACAAASEDGVKCEQLLKLICSKEFPDQQIRKEIFAVAVARCGDMARPDVILELAWRLNMMDFAMPYMIGQLRSMGERIKKLEERKVEVVVEAPKQEDGFGDFQQANTGDNWQGDGNW